MISPLLLISVQVCFHSFFEILFHTLGRYEYKFLVDGRWMVDDSGVKTDNPMGSQNNVISIDEQDFAVLI